MSRPRSFRRPGLIAAADGAASVGVIAAELKRRTGLVSNVVTLCRR